MQLVNLKRKKTLESDLNSKILQYVDQSLYVFTYKSYDNNVFVSFCKTKVLISFDKKSNLSDELFIETQTGKSFLLKRVKN